jgi:signal transduction histidine kinase
LEFHYTALSFRWPEKTRFQYMLEGFDRTWLDAGIGRIAAYTNVPPGDYQFHVRACNPEGEWNVGGAVLVFRIKPYFRQTPYFFILLGLTGLSLLYGVVNRRIRKLRERERKLQHRVAERTLQLAEVNQALRESNARLKDLDQAKTDFLNVAAHEIRAPLTSILGFSKIIRRKFESILRPALPSADLKIARALSQMRENMEIIDAEGVRLTTLLNDLLDIAKLEAGRIQWRKEHVDVAEVIEHSLAASAALFEQKQVVCEAQIEPRLPPVIADRARLIQVLINLLANAAQFSPPSSRVTVRAMRAGHHVMVAVRDMGVGLTRQECEKLFEKFHQVPGDHSGNRRGTGLGLAICKQIVEQLGGQIRVESHPNEGSVFIFSVPADHPTGDIQIGRMDENRPNVVDPG